MAINLPYLNSLKGEITYRQCADALGVTTRTIKKHVADGEIRAVGLGNHKMILRFTVMDALERWAKPKPPRIKVEDARLYRAALRVKTGLAPIKIKAADLTGDMLERLSCQCFDTTKPHCQAWQRLTGIDLASSCDRCHPESVQWRKQTSIWQTVAGV